MSQFTPKETDRLHKLFSQGVRGALKALFWSDIPKGLTEEAVIKYGQMTSKLIAAGNDPSGSQGLRKWVVNKTLLKMRLNRALGLAADSAVAGGALVGTVLGAMLYVISLAAPLGDAELTRDQVNGGATSTRASAPREGWPKNVTDILFLGQKGRIEHWLPSRGNLVVRLKTAPNRKGMLAVFDPSGLVVFYANGYYADIDLNVKPGTYILRAYEGGNCCAVYNSGSPNERTTYQFTGNIKDETTNLFTAPATDSLTVTVGANLATKITTE